MRHCYIKGVIIAPRAKRLFLAITAVLAALSLTLCTNPTFIEFSRYVGPSAIRPAGFDSDLQWNMEMINAPGAWAIVADTVPVFQTEERTIVAVIDTQVSEHHDLTGKIVDRYDIAPSGGPNGNGLGREHGTHVTGTIVAEPQDYRDFGIESVGSRYVDVLSIRALRDNGSGFTDDVIAAIDHAAAFVHGATNRPVSVINLSLGGGSPDAGLYAAIERAVAGGITVVAAAGNDGREGMIVPAYFDNTIAVGSIDRSAERSSFSHFGTGLDFVAPGSWVLSTVGDTSYAEAPGTSMATPHVAGVAALLYAVEPGLNQAAVYSILRATARDLGASGWDKYYGHGLVDAQAALEYLVNLRRRIPRAPMGQEPGGGSGGVRINVAELSGAQLPPPEAEIDTTTLIVRFADGTDSADPEQLQAFADAVADRVGPATVRAVGTDTAVVELLAGQSVIDALQQLAGVIGVQFSQPNYVYRAVW